MIYLLINSAIPQLLLTNAADENVPYIWGARIFMVVIAAGLVLMVKTAWKKNEA